MGAGGSVLPPGDEALDKPTVKALVGEHWFDEAKFDDAAGEDGKVTRAALEHIIADTQSLATASAAVPNADDPSAGSAPSAVTTAAPSADAPAANLESPAGGSGGGSGPPIDTYVASILDVLDDAGRTELARRVLEAVQAREKKVAKAAAAAVPADYSKSFSGSAADTKAERDFGKMLSGDEEGTEAQQQQDPLLLPVVGESDSARYGELRAAGKWHKLLGGAGCFIFFHTTTHETVSMRPEDFVDEGDQSDATAVKEEDDAGGLHRVVLTDLVAELDKCVDEKLTPLLVDNSDDRKVERFFEYHGKLVDFTGLGLPINEQRKRKIKPKAEMEKLRVAAVAAIKAGSTLVLNLGNIGDNVNFKALCKRDVFPIEMFSEAGKRILTPSFPEPRCAKMFRDEDKEASGVTFRDTFRLVLITALTPAEVQSSLAESLPMENIKPMYIAS